MEVFSSPSQRNCAMWCIPGRHPTQEGARETQEAHGRRRDRAAVYEAERAVGRADRGHPDPEHIASVVQHQSEQLEVSRWRGLYARPTGLVLGAFPFAPRTEALCETCETCET
jgi:hypothetical protein